MATTKRVHTMTKVDGRTEEDGGKGTWAAVDLQNRMLKHDQDTPSTSFDGFTEEEDRLKEMTGESFLLLRGFYPTILSQGERERLWNGDRHLARDIADAVARLMYEHIVKVYSV